MALAPCTKIGLQVLEQKKAVFTLLLFFSRTAGLKKAFAHTKKAFLRIVKEIEGDCRTGFS
jgi:hypothetical protein